MLLRAAMNLQNNGSLVESPPAPRGVKYYLACRLLKRPYLVNLEVTKHCNAKCDFCAYWQEASPNELKDFSPVIKKLLPIVASVTGGEPLIRKDLIDIIKGIRPYCHYLVMVSNGALLTEDIADSLSLAGLNQLAISLDYLSDKHDEVRKIPGLFNKISTLIPRLTAKGYKIVLNTIIMEANLDHIIPLAHQAKAWGAGISFSSYCSLKKGDDSLMVTGKKIKRVDEIIAELKTLKSSLGHIRNSNYYLNGVANYFRSGGTKDCKAGKNWLQVTPQGFIKPCSELQPLCSYSEFRQGMVPEITCTQCWYTCRGESEASHLSPDRLIELFRA